MIDSHVHVVSEDETTYPRHSTPGLGAAGGARSVTAEALLEAATAEGVDQIVFVQSFAGYGFDNRYVLDMGRRYGDRVAVVCGIDPASSDAGAIANQCVEAGARGLRVLAIASDFDVDGLRPVFEVAARSNVAICILTTHAILARLGPILESHPSVPVVLDHCGLQPLNGNLEDLGAEALFALAEFDSVLLKISSRVFGHAEGDVAAIVSSLVDEFGAARMMWGSDFPASPVPTYGAAVEAARSAVSGLTPRDREHILHGTAAHLWKFASH